MDMALGLTIIYGKSQCVKKLQLSQYLLLPDSRALSGAFNFELGGVWGGFVSEVCSINRLFMQIAF